MFALGVGKSGEIMVGYRPLTQAVFVACARSVKGLLE